jgi:hypothetical protein
LQLRDGHFRRRLALGRRRWLALSGMCVLLGVAGTVSADEVTVPIGLQAQLLAKVAEYDRHFAERAQGLAQVLLVLKQGHSESTHVVTEMQTNLARIDSIVGVAHRETVWAYSGANELAEFCKNRHTSIVYFGPGLEGDIPDIVRAFSDLDVLTISSVAGYVDKGIVIGFDLVSSRPKVVVNLKQARNQQVDFRADLLKMARVIE